MQLFRREDFRRGFDFYAGSTRLATFRTYGDGILAGGPFDAMRATLLRTDGDGRVLWRKTIGPNDTTR